MNYDYGTHNSFLMLIAAIESVPFMSGDKDVPDIAYFPAELEI